MAVYVLLERVSMYIAEGNRKADHWMVGELEVIIDYETDRSVGTEVV